MSKKYSEPLRYFLCTDLEQYAYGYGVGFARTGPYHCLLKWAAQAYQ